MKVSDIMTKEVMTVKESDSVLLAAELLARHGFHGVPVVDEKKTLVGLVTQSNLITKTSHVHIPTILTLLKKFDLYRKDKKFVEEQLRSMGELKVREVMNTEPPLIYEGQSVDTAIMQLSRIEGVSPLSVVSLNRKLLGVVARSDILKSFAASSPVAPAESNKPQLIDQKIDLFLNDFERQFLFISKLRTRAWLLFNIAFLVVGITIALIIFW